MVSVLIQLLVQIFSILWILIAEKSIVYPKLVNKNNYKRSIDENSDLHFEIELNKSKVLLDLKPNTFLLTENAIIERHKTNLYNSTTVKKVITKNNFCHYQGSIRNYSSISTVALSLCKGMVTRS